MSIPVMREKIIAILAELGELEDAKRSDLLSRPEEDIEFVAMGMDSLTALDLCVSLEDSTGLTVEPTDLVSYPSINRLAVYLGEGGGATP